MMLMLILCFLVGGCTAQIQIKINLKNRFYEILSDVDTLDLKTDSISNLSTPYYGEGDVFYLNRIKFATNTSAVILYSRKSPVIPFKKKISLEQKDSLIYIDLLERFKPIRSSTVRLVDYKISALQQTASGYRYVDVFETILRYSYYGRRRYTSSMHRAFMIDGIEYNIRFYTIGPPYASSIPYNRTACRSKRAVCKDFKELVDSLIIE
jgi:hypothetical protein